MADKKTSNHILLVEDSPDIQMLLRELFSREGYRVSSADNGQEALDFLQKGDLPSLILLDMMMPIMDGSAFLRVVEKSDTLSRIPIALMTAHGESAVRSEDVKGRTYLKKPVDIDALLAVASRFCTLP